MFSLTSEDRDCFPGEASGSLLSVSAARGAVPKWEYANRPLVSFERAGCWLVNNRCKYPSKISSRL